MKTCEATSKTCRKCGIAKPLSEYHANKSYRDGLQGKCKACVKEYHQVNRPAIAEKQRAWLDANAEYAADRRRRYYADRPHLRWEEYYRHRARKYGFAIVVESFTRADLVERYGDACWHCGGDFEECDHYPQPVSQGGPHTLDNCRPSCLTCNRRGERKGG